MINKKLVMIVAEPIPAPTNLAAVDSLLKSFAEDFVLCNLFAAASFISDDMRLFDEIGAVAEKGGVRGKAKRDGRGYCSD